MPATGFANPRARAAGWSAGLLAAALLGVALATTRPWGIGNLKPDQKLADAVRWGMWWASAINSLGLAALAATAKWWTAPAAGGGWHLARPKMTRGFLFAVFAAMLVCGAMGSMRLRHSFWDDEVYAMRRAIHGQWKRVEDSAPKFRPVEWRETLWGFEKPQHVLHSVLSRCSLGIWQAVAKPGGLMFREDVVRFPGFIAGVLSVGAIALLGWRIGFPWAGGLAAWLLAMHPWHVRYVSEARGYSLMFLFLPLVFAALIEALVSGSWRWWAAYSAGLLVLMYANALNIYAAAGAGACGALAVALRVRSPGGAVQCWRFAVSGLLAGMVFLQLMLPCVPQFLNYLEKTAVKREMGLHWLSSFFGLLFAGEPWTNTGSRSPGPYMELLSEAASHPLFFWFVLGSAILLCAAGAFVLFKRGGVSALVALGLLAPGPAAFFISKAKGQHLFEWYLLFMLPGLVLAIAVGADALRSRLPRKVPAGAGAFLLAVFLVGGFALFTAPQRAYLLGQSLQKIRESVEFSRPDLDPFAKENRSILTGSFMGPPDPYDPNIWLIRSMDDLGQLVALADATNRTLDINAGFMQTAEARFPAITASVRDPRLFDLVATLRGYEPINDRLVFRYKGHVENAAQILASHGSDPAHKEAQDRYDTY